LIEENLILKKSRFPLFEQIKRAKKRTISKQKPSPFLIIIIINSIQVKKRR